MSGLLTSLGPAGTALSLLVLGHILGDFTFQTDGIAENKHRYRTLLIHGLIVLGLHLITFSLLLTWWTGIILAGVVIIHTVIDKFSAKARNGNQNEEAEQEDINTTEDDEQKVDEWRNLLLFLGDQTAHIIVLVVAWFLIVMSQPWTNSIFVAKLGGIGAVPWGSVTTGAVYLSALAFANEGGNAIVTGVLPTEDPGPKADGGDDSDDAKDLEVGSIIGTLERWIIIILGIAGRWEAVALVVAVKSIARFRLLDRRDFAEYFLVGTLASVLVAISVAILVQFLV
jgi:hypothetical protein